MPTEAELEQKKTESISWNNNINNVNWDNLSKNLNDITLPNDVSKDERNEYLNLTYKPEDLEIDNKIVVVDKKLNKNFIKDPIEGYTKKILEIRWMEWNETNIPDQHKQDVINSINSLQDFEKMRIVWCTDANPIQTEEWISKNKSEFERISKEFVSKWWSALSYQDLLKSPNDPQNTILWYRRAMEWTLSLNLTPDQMEKIIVTNKLWVIQNKEEGKQERWFDIEADYSDKIEHVVEGETSDFLYEIFWKLSKESLGRTNVRNEKWDLTYLYHMSSIDLKTHIDPDNPTELYTRVMWHIPNVLANDIATQEKIHNQIKWFLKVLINNCWWEFNNWVWSAKNITRRQYYTIVSARDKLLSASEFKSLMENDLSVLENKNLEMWKSIKQFIEENKDNPVTWVWSWDKINTYYLKDWNKRSPKDRAISSNDYILLWLYFQVKNNRQ